LTVIETDAAEQVPSGSCDCHMHVFGPPERYRGSADRSYDPRERRFADYEAVARAAGFERVVLVQPSAYGTDNSCLLDALRLRPERMRAVVVIGPEHDEDALRAMHRAGTRGARLNLMTPRINDFQVAQARLREAARRVTPLGWHLQIYADLRVAEVVAPALKDIGAPVVFDHLGGATRDDRTDAPGFQALLSELAAGRCWVKLSGADILSRESADFTRADPFAAALIAANDKHVVWGSDWPHLVHQAAGIGDEAPPAAFRPVDELALRRSLRRWAGSDDVLHRVLVDNPQRLYGF
jgi:predicted TIM-barrel fold metal-dependent hydrolase